MEYELICGSDTLTITNYITELSGGLSEYAIKTYDRIGDGVILSRSNYFGNKKFSVKASFSNNSASNRDEFLKWMTKPRSAEIYLQKTDDLSFVGRVRVYPVIVSGETYSKLLKRYTSEYELHSEESLWQSTSVTTHSGLDIASVESITNAGLKVYAIYTFSFSTTATYIRLYISEGYGFHVTTSIAVSDVIQVVTTSNNILAYKNGGLLSNVFSAGSQPFPLENGETDIICNSDGSATYTVTYYSTRA